VELGGRVTGARIFSLTNISGSFRCSPPFGGSLVAGQLGVGDAASWELEEVASVRGVTQVSVLIAGMVVTA
jgi:hypothetical protein